MVKLIPGQNDLSTTHPELTKQWHPTKNLLTPQQITAGSTKKIWWQCEHGHEWEAVCYSRVAGNGCPICSGRQTLPGYNDLVTTMPDLAAQWHPIKNGELTPQNVTNNSHKKVWWLGECKHEWEAPVSERVRGRGCPVCKSKKVVVGINDLATVYPNIALQWHNELNEKAPTQVLPQSNKIVWWRCNQGHEYQTSPAHRIRKGAGCPICSNKQILVGYNDLATTHPKLATEWHPTKNALTPQEVTIGSDKKVWRTCSKGHEWEALIYSRQHSGCPFCSGNKAWRGFNDLATTHPKLSAEWHPTRNEKLTAYDITAGSNHKVWWLGQCGHEWMAEIFSRTTGCGCPICDAENKTSFPEKAIMFYISKIFSDAIPNIRLEFLGSRSLDIFIPSLMTAIEYDGQKWHQDSTRDHRKNELCRENGIRLIRIREPGCPVLSSECILLADLSDQALARSIIELCNLLNCNIDVNIQRDRTAIYNTYIQNEKTENLENMMPELALEWHPTKNGALTPQMFSPHSNKKVWWICKEGHGWEDSCNHRASGRGCPICARIHRQKGHTSVSK